MVNCALLHEEIITQIGGWSMGESERIRLASALYELLDIHEKRAQGTDSNRPQCDFAALLPLSGRLLGGRCRLFDDFFFAAAGRFARQPPGHAVTLHLLLHTLQLLPSGMVLRYVLGTVAGTAYRLTHTRLPL